MFVEAAKELTPPGLVNVVAGTTVNLLLPILFALETVLSVYALNPEVGNVQAAIVFPELFVYTYKL